MCHSEQRLEQKKKHINKAQINHCQRLSVYNILVRPVGDLLKYHANT